MISERRDSQHIPIVSSSIIPYNVLQFEAVAGSYSHSPANRGGEDGRTLGQARGPATLLPVYMTQDSLTLAVLTLLLGGWLAFALTYPVVSLYFYVCVLLRCICV